MTAEDRELPTLEMALERFENSIAHRARGATVYDLAVVRTALAAERVRADAAERDARRYQLALEDCRLLAARWRNHPGWVHILRFCEAVGVTGSPLRDAATEGVQQGSAA